MPPGPDPEPPPENPAPPPLPPPRPPPQRRPPQQRQPPPRRPLPPRPRPQKKHRHHHHGKASRARAGLVVIFLLFRTLDFIFLSTNSDPQLYRRLVSSIIISAIWTTALLLGIWLRKPWARLIFIGLLGLNVLLGIIVFPMTVDMPALFQPLLLNTAVAAGSFAYLVLSRDVRRLVSRDRE